MKTGIELIAEERQRQMSVEGWTSKHDDKHTSQTLSRAAVCYAEQAIARGWLPEEKYKIEPPHEDWPWTPKWWKPKSPIRDLVKAGALIAAEIDRLQRLEAKRKGKS